MEREPDGPRSMVAAVVNALWSRCSRGEASFADVRGGTLALLLRPCRGAIAPGATGTRMRQLARRFPTQQVHLILDNYSPHKHRKVRAGS